jgi:DNA-binding CsgD family transcriptional regulator
MGPDDPEWPDGLATTVRLAAWGSRFTDAVALATRALALNLAADAAGLIQLGLSDALMLGGRRRDVIALSRSVLSRSDVPPELRANFLHNLGFALAMDGQVSAAAQAYRQAITTAGSADASVVLGCRIGLGFVTGSGGDLAGGLAMAEECARTAAQGGAALRQRFPQAWLATALRATDRFEAADEVIAAHRKEAEAFGASWALEFCERSACSLRMAAGRLGDAELQAEATLALIDAFEMWHDSDLPFGVLVLVAIHRNELETAECHLARSNPYRELYARGLPAYLDRAEAALRDASGDAGGALDVLRDLYDEPELLTQNLALESTLAPELVRLALRAGDSARAAVVVDASAALARGNSVGGAFAAASAHAEGLVTGDVERLVAAADRLRQSPRVLARASAFEDAGQALIVRGEVAAGARFLHDALAMFREVGAARDQARIARHLRAAGVRPPARRAPDERPKLGWDSLTGAELRVVRLVAQGLTNRQVAERLYLSSYTVATHLRHVFEKVGVASRMELARSAMDRGIAT